MKIKFLGRDNGTKKERDADLLLCIIAKVTQSKIEITDQIKKADLVIVYPYIVGKYSYRWRWLLASLKERLFRRSASSHSNILRWLLGVGKAKVLFVSHENLNRPYWWNWVGCLLLQSDIPRLTFWPKEIDPKGARFPYWYNYINWPSYPRESLYQRFGQFYQIDGLMSPIKEQKERRPYAVAIGSHQDYPREALLNSVRKIMQVDCYGGMGEHFVGSKIDLMRQYKYAFCPENSTGYGYETEKLPEAWIAGCIPIGIYLNPYSDFNPEVIKCNYNGDLAYKQKLLLKTPDLKEIEEYVSKILC